MTLDEAIKHAEEVAEEKEKEAWEAQLQEEYKTIKSCKECAKEHRQLAEWLKELKQLREHTRWILVSERLPEDAYGCIVTVLDVDLRTQNEFENILPYFVGYDGETWNNADGEPIPYEVIAWMKAPEPYKAEGSGE